MVDPRQLTLRQNKTFRVIFRMKDAFGAPVPLTGWGATFTVLQRSGGAVLLSVNDLSDDPGHPADPSVVLEPGGTPAVGEIHVRLGADQTAGWTRTLAYDCAIYSKADPTEIQPVCSGPLVVLAEGADA